MVRPDAKPVEYVQINIFEMEVYISFLLFVVVVLRVIDGLKPTHSPFFVNRELTKNIH